MTHQLEYLNALKSYNVDLVNACKVCYNKYRFEKYSLKKNETISYNDYIIKGTNREMLAKIISKNSCTDQEFLDALSECSQDDLDYIGL